jgi:putative tryptophan/tyrosine transport system substrate-binding protein
MAADLVQRRAAVIATTGGAAAVFAARAATKTIPIVFGMATDPVEAGVVASLSRPGGNLTGLSFMSSELLPRRLQLLHELVPGARRIAVLVNPNAPLTEETIKAVKAGASAIGLEIDVLNPSNDRELDKAFASLVEKRAEGLLVNTSPLFTNLRVQLAILAARHAVPTVYFTRAFAESGGLMSYGSNLLDQYRQLGLYAGRILKGERPSEMPVMQPTSFELVINLKTAKALGLTIPETLLATADEVIQ